jgi:hypothetical protein
MIDLNIEEAITLAAATRLRLVQRNGRRPDVSTLWRWAMRGRRGVRLETIQIGGSRCTSREAILRFFTRISTDKPDDVSQLTMHRASAIARAERDLADDGIG